MRGTDTTPNLQWAFLSYTPNRSWEIQAGRKRMAVVVRNGKHALTHYATQRAWGTACALLRCRLATSSSRSPASVSASTAGTTASRSCTR